MARLIDLSTLAHPRHLVHSAGAAPFLELLAGRIAADFARWPEFDKSARSASHSALGVIELMPVADALSTTASSTSTATPAPRCWDCPP